MTTVKKIKNVSQNGIDLIKKYEGCRLESYQCAAGVYTIGYGHTKEVTAGQKITQAQADELLMQDIERFEKHVASYNGMYGFTQNEFDALVSFAFNVGSIKQLTQGGQRTRSEVAEAMLKYCKAGGKVLVGLQKRRKEEQALFLSSNKELGKKGITKVFNIHAGHNSDGMPACGAVGFLEESTEARNIKTHLIKMLRDKGYMVYDCTVDDGKDQNDVLKKIVSKCNEHTVDLDISIHLNAGAKDEKGNGKTTGVECLVYDLNSKTADSAKAICEAISKIGFTNRGVKERKDLYVLKKTKSPAVLIEACFVDDKDDFLMFDAQEIAEAIASVL